MMLTQQRLRELFRYDPESGNFIRLITRSHNARAGQIAGTPTKGDLGSGGGYLQINIDGHIYLNHRLAFLYMTGAMPSIVDHLNHDRSDNRWANLRAVADQAENGQNMARKSNNSSGVTGVYWDKKRGQWAAEIMIGRRKRFIGRFKDLQDALKARRNAELEHGFHVNHGTSRQAAEVA